MKTLNNLKAGALALVACHALPAAAYTLTGDPDCDVAAAVFAPGYDACVGAYLLDGGENDVTDGEADNIVNQILNTDDVFGSADWTYMAKDDGAGSSFFTTNGIDSTSGSISFNVDAINAVFGPDFLNTYDVAISFKAAKNFSIYEWDASLGSDTISWTTDGIATNKKGETQALSHVSVFFRNGGSADSVPEPGTIALLALGLVGLGASRRRSQQG